ncbi:Uncharacterised protein [Corynebacterium pilosum]|uniref:Uncharacterized protein n=2 Tax=Corynebacterium pilosum TaxID=35756 RepID=A0A376CM48_9CORY|nr:Uncharacterised protein [Corynebacterium pilosum]
MPSLDVMDILNDITEDSEFFRDDENRLVGSGRRGSTLVEVKLGEIPMDHQGQLELAEAVPAILREYGWDRLIYVTDLPLVAFNRPVVAQSAVDSDGWVISAPSFGWFGARRRLRKELISLIDGNGGVVGTSEPRTAGRGQDQDSTVRSQVLDTPWRAVQLIAGTARSNRPWRMPRVLTSSLAAMAASGGFGVFYGSIWDLAHSMSFTRAVGVGLLSILSFTMWIILRNRLFVRADENRSPWRRNVDNIATFTTIALAATILYVLVFAVMTVLTAAIVPTDYLASSVSVPTGWFSYFTIGWLSASLGTFAGAIGSNFDESAEIVGATYSEREYERRRKWGQFDDQQDQDDEDDESKDDN